MVDHVRPKSLAVAANGLSHHVLEWPKAASAGVPARTVVLVHGYMDAAGTWDRVAPALAEKGHRVLAPDMRGFGEAPRAPAGAYYHFVDYVFDLADIVDALSPDEPVALVGHSMGGTITTMFAGTFPERVSRLASIEGLGPPDNPFEVGPLRMRRWVEEVRGMRRRSASRAEVNAPPTLSRAEALVRLTANHPRVPAEVLEDRLHHLAVDVGEGRVAWRFDPLHRTTSPTPFFTKLFTEFGKRVTCPVLFVSGGPSGFHPPDEDERLASFADITTRAIDDAGHMIHWTRPDALVAALLPFLA